MKVRIPLIFLAISLALALTWAVAAQTSEPIQVEVRASDAPFTLSLNLGPADPTIDPALADWHGAEQFVVNQLFLGLTWVNDETGEPLPELATSWAMSPDATVFTFTLRSGVTWSDGNPVTAYDVRYSILRALDPAAGSDYAQYLYLIQNAEEYHTGVITDASLVGVTVISPTRLRFTLERPAAYLPSVLAQPVARTVPQWAIEAHGVPTWTYPANIVTNGPYRLIAWSHGVSMTLEKSSGYYDAANVQIERVSLRIADNAAAWGMYQAGQLDSALVPQGEWEVARNDPGLGQELHIAPSLGTFYYGFNTAKAPFTSTLVRKAFIAAVDRQGIISNATHYAEQPALTFTPPGIWGHVSATGSVGIPYDPVQARLWLAAAGYPNGQGLPPITLMLDTRFYTQDLAIASAIRQNWMDNLSVTVTISETTHPDYLKLLETDPPQVWQLRWLVDYRDAYNFLYDGVNCFGRINYGGWTNPTYDGLLTLAARTDDLCARESLYEQAEEILVETDAVMLPVYYWGNGIATQPYLQRTYGDGGFGGRIADWRVTWRVYLPLALRNY